MIRLYFVRHGSTTMMIFCLKSLVTIASFVNIVNGTLTRVEGTVGYVL